MKEIEKLFEQYTRQKPVEIYELPSSGSNRRYFRIKGDGITLIGAAGTSVEENVAFIEIGRHFMLKGLPVPKVLCVSENKEYYLQEDLGDVTLFNHVAAGRESGHYSDYEKSLLKKTRESFGLHGDKPVNPKRNQP